MSASSSGSTPKKEIDPNHPIDPHHHSTGDWWCYTCKRKLKGSFMRPVIPWQHSDAPPPQDDPIPTPDLSKEGS